MKFYSIIHVYSDLDSMRVEVGPVVADSEKEVEDDKMDLDESLNENPTAQVHISEKAKSPVANLRKRMSMNKRQKPQPGLRQSLDNVPTSTNIAENEPLIQGQELKQMRWNTVNTPYTDIYDKSREFLSTKVVVTSSAAAIFTSAVSVFTSLQRKEHL